LDQFKNVFCKIQSTNNLKDLIDYASNSTKHESKYKERFLLDSESLNKIEYLQLIDFFESNTINPKQWIIIQSINETEHKLSEFCEKNNNKFTAIKKYF